MKKPKAASELTEALGLSPADGAEIDIRSDLNDKIINVIKTKELTIHSYLRWRGDHTIGA